MDRSPGVSAVSSHDVCALNCPPGLSTGAGCGLQPLQPSCSPRRPQGSPYSPCPVSPPPPAPPHFHSLCGITIFPLPRGAPPHETPLAHLPQFTCGPWCTGYSVTGYSAKLPRVWVGARGVLCPCPAQDTHSQISPAVG